MEGPRLKAPCSLDAAPWALPSAPLPCTRGGLGMGLEDLQQPGLCAVPSRARGVSTAGPSLRAGQGTRTLRLFEM